MDNLSPSPVSVDIVAEWRELINAGALREFAPALRSGPGACTFRGKSLIDFVSWDPLGCRLNRRVVRAMQQYIDREGLGVSSPRLALGSSGTHLQAETKLARFLGWESSLLFSSRSQGILALLGGVLGERDTILVDEGFFPVVADAAVVSGANATSISIQDYDRLRSELLRAQGARRLLVMVASLSPISGAVADISKIVAIANEFGAAVLVDETNMLGVSGVCGAGSLDGLSLRTGILGVFGDLGVGIGLGGGFFAGGKEIVDLVRSRSRSFTAEGPTEGVVIAGLEQAIQVVEESASDRIKLSGLVEHAHVGVINIFPHILPKVVGNSIFISFKELRDAVGVQDALLARGILVGCVPRGTFLDPGGAIRISVRAEHSVTQLDGMIASLYEIAKRR